MTAQSYSVKAVHESLLRTFHQYLQAQYHIWDEDLIVERNRIINEVGNTFQKPRLEATPQYATGLPYSELNIPQVAQAILDAAASLPETGIPKTPYVHQCRAIERFVSNGSDLIVATGTGSGKTESFLMPVLATMALEASLRPNMWKRPAIRALLLYPMNALVNDQLARLRRIFSSPVVNDVLSGDGRRARFGMYTSRTPYPGQATRAKDKDRVVAELNKLYFEGMTSEYRSRLQAEGKWPAKDVEMFLENGLVTSPGDSELLTRHEMQVTSPDLLVTNYSMLEYMMLRPLEASLFEQTKEWLHAHPENYLTIVLDEAHMYRGSGGAEVAYLLRRLQSRLEVPRQKVRYILTSASLGSSEEAHLEIKRFAVRLTGGEPEKFDLITSVLESRTGGACATKREQEALAQFNYSTLLEAVTQQDRARAELVALTQAMGLNLAAPGLAYKDLQHYAFELLQQVPVAALVAEQLTASPRTLEDVAREAFAESAGREAAAEALLALLAFAKDAATGRPFCAIRSHLFFRGLAGLYVCTNARCQLKPSSDFGLLGRMYSEERLRCECGARVYELLTHRACGAAYLRGYMQEEDGDFLWHKASNGTWSERRLVEAQFYVIPPAELRNFSGDIKWLHTRSGRLVSKVPEGLPSELFLPLLFPGRAAKERGRTILSERTCPACTRGAGGNSPIAMDLATKGEAPFAHIVRAQVAAQPASGNSTPETPNAGRKTLIFSDGRQKAARLARDIPREIQLDVFRQAIFISARDLLAIGEEPRLDGRIYVGFLKCLADHNLTFFDGTDQSKLEDHLRDFADIFGSDLKAALDDLPKPPPRYSAVLLKQLGAPYYSVSALTLGYVIASKTAAAAIRKRTQQYPTESIEEIVTAWIQRLLGRYAFDGDLSEGVRKEASRYPSPPSQPEDGLTKLQKKFLEDKGFDVNYLVNTFADALCQRNPDGTVFINPSRVVLKPALDEDWVQCESCRTVSPMLFMGNCPNCTKPGASYVNPAFTSYLRARKGLWRDPVVSATRGEEPPMSIDVQEHSAQLSYKDSDTPAPTSETFERKFRDILRPGERAVDVLSCTTTMEVGIDIGSLIAVAMRNVPPMRQNYQQRAGRAGRRGAAVSTVVTYAQTGAHDSYYFLNPDRMLAGDPPRPVLDTQNERIATRHVYAQLLQDFFRPLAIAEGNKASNIFTVLGDTWSFYNSDSHTSFIAFERWLSESEEAKRSLDRAQQWLPSGLSATAVAQQFVQNLDSVAPHSKDGLESSLIEFLFGHGLLPSYAFPRDLCSLQIQQRVGSSDFKIAEQAQQGMNVALSEYAPGRLIVVNKKTYRIGTVASAGPDTEPNRAEALFERARVYRHCSQCTYTAGFVTKVDDDETCPQCGAEAIRHMTVIRPEVVYPRDKREIDELDDEQVFSRVTQAQLPLPDSERHIQTVPFGAKGGLGATSRTQNLIVVNEGGSSSNESGFMVCTKCGKVLLEGDNEGPHSIDYYVRSFKGPQRSRCDGRFERVLLGYDFPSDVLLLRVALHAPLRFGVTSRRNRKPIEDALQTLCDALTLAVSRILDVDSREINAGFRFGNDGKADFADIFIYDTLSGGAGYALEAGNSFERVFEEALRLMEECTCSASCEKCLRHYGNRFHHADLDRFLGIDLAHYVLDGIVPEEFQPATAQEILMPLAEMLGLAGWEVTRQGGRLLAVDQGKRFTIAACPSLRACEVRLRMADQTQLTFTPYELSRDLPSAFAELS